jgi:hypothetical protein
MRRGGSFGADWRILACGERDGEGAIPAAGQAQRAGHIWAKPIVAPRDRVRTTICDRSAVSHTTANGYPVLRKIQARKGRCSLLRVSKGA